MGKKKKKNKIINDEITTYIFTKESLRCIINDSLGEVQNPDLLNDRTKELIAWLRSNTDICDIRSKKSYQMGFHL